MNRPDTNPDYRNCAYKQGQSHDQQASKSGCTKEARAVVKGDRAGGPTGEPGTFGE